MDADKPIPVLNLPPVSFIVVITSHGISGSIQVAWDPERSLYVINKVGVPVEEALADIVMKVGNVVIHMDFDGE